MVREIAPEEQLVAGEQRTGRDGAILLAALTEEAEPAVGDGLRKPLRSRRKSEPDDPSFMLIQRPRYVPSP
jgi:hypothetical protein